MIHIYPFSISIVTRNPQVSQDHSDPQLYCGSEWSSPFWPAILPRQIAYIKIRMRKSVFFCSRPSHEFEKTALFIYNILSNNNITQRNFWDTRGRIYKGALCAYLCHIFDWRLGKTKDNFWRFSRFYEFSIARDTCMIQTSLENFRKIIW